MVAMPVAPRSQFGLEGSILPYERAAGQTARRALAEHPRLILGHECSAASIRAAPLYADAHVSQISITATNSALTDMNIKSLFRMVGRNDAQDVVAADLIADRWPDAKVGVIDDGESYGAELALEKGLMMDGSTAINDAD